MCSLHSYIVIRSLAKTYLHRRTKCLYCYSLNIQQNTVDIKKQFYGVKCSGKIYLSMKLTTPEFKSIITDGVKFLKDLFEENGYELRIVGGAVRDLLLGNVPHDIDFATTALPDEMRDLFQKHEIRLINARGESHGTITPRINDVNYEITTLRLDEKTDGRHAVVRFTKDWFEDASRRDLTINAMFLDLDGTVHDFFNGIEDLKNKRIAFVGDAATRIQEDYLRILRYFRFFGRVAENPEIHDEKTLVAIKENGSGLAKISGERIQGELFKILSGNYGIELLRKMLSLDLGQYIGLPANCNMEEFNKVAENIRSNNFVVEPVTILCSLLNNSDDVTNLIERIKPPGDCRNLAYFIMEERNKEKPPVSLKHYQKLVIHSKNSKFTRSAIVQYLRYSGDAVTLRDFEGWNDSGFPLTGNDILRMGIIDRRKLGFILKELQSIWVDSNFTLKKKELEDRIVEISEKFEDQRTTYVKNKKQKHM